MATPNDISTSSIPNADANDIGTTGATGDPDPITRPEPHKTILGKIARFFHNIVPGKGGLKSYLASRGWKSRTQLNLEDELNGGPPPERRMGFFVI